MTTVTYRRVTDITSAIVELSDIVDARYGGKALGLAELVRAGRPRTTLERLFLRETVDRNE